VSERTFFIRQGDTIQGPFDVERIRSWIAAGRVRPDMELSEDGQTFHRGDAFEGLFDADSPRHGGSPSRPPAAPSIIVIGCRLLAVVGLVLALVVGQWVHVVQPVNDPRTGGMESRLVFGLTEFVLGASQGNQLTTLGTISYASIQPGESIPVLTNVRAESIDAASTSRTLGWAIGGLVVLATLLAAASFGDGFGKPQFTKFATFGFLASALASIAGWVFMKSGLVSLLASESARMGGARGAPATTTGGFSLYTVILALLFLGIAEAKSRVASVDDSRRRKVRRAPKRR